MMNQLENIHEEFLKFKIAEKRFKDYLYIEKKNIQNLEEKILCSEESKKLNEMLYNSDQFPLLFLLALKLDKNRAIKFLETFYLAEPIDNLAIYETKLDLFLHYIFTNYGKQELKKLFLNSSEELINHTQVKNTFDTAFDFTLKELMETDTSFPPSKD